MLQGIEWIKVREVVGSRMKLQPFYNNKKKNALSAGGIFIQKNK